MCIISANSNSSNSLTASQSDKTDLPYEADPDSETPGYEKIKIKAANPDNTNKSGLSEKSLSNVDVLEDDSIVEV